MGAVRINMRQLQMFRAVVKVGSVSGAARLLRVSQPAVTKTLRSLEVELDLSLFVRVRGRLLPTQEAETLMPAIDHIFGTIEAFDQLALQIGTGMSGRVRIASVTNLAMSLVARVINEMNRDFPNIVFDLHALPTRHVIDYVNTRQVDIGILDVPYPAMDLDVEELLAFEVVCVMRSDNPLSRHGAISPPLLKDALLITFGGETMTGWRLREAFRAAGTPYRIAVTSTSSPAACAIIADNDRAIGLLDPFMPMSSAFPQLISRPFHPRIEMLPRVLLPGGWPISIATRIFIDRMRQIEPQPTSVEPASGGISNS
jgi:DNA-binding transcriptional LysR family regulator